VVWGVRAFTRDCSLKQNWLPWGQSKSPQWWRVHARTPRALRTHRSPWTRA